jgi:6-phosphogluconolactonase
MVANYGSGSIASFPILRDGQIGEAKSVVQHHGSSVNKGRQQGPHAHFIATDPSDRFAFCADLGLDKVLIYKLDPAAATLTQNDPPFYTSAPGSGPRHLAFHPDALHAFLITEMASTLTLLDYDSLRGSLKEVQTISTLPPDYKGPEWGAEVAVHPNGKFVYCSNRAQDAIALFEFDAAADSIKRVENVSTEGKTPRHFVISPSGKWLIAENQESASIITYRIDQKTGRLTKNGPLVAIDSPVCVALFR